MPWSRARLNGAKVWAKVDAEGALAAEGGRVQVHYRPGTSKAYFASVQRVALEKGEIFPDDHCQASPEDAQAEAPGAKSSASKKSSAAKKASPSSPPATRPEEGWLLAYADGACSGNPGPAGLGVVLVDQDQRSELSEYLGRGTNNIAELTAILRALEAAQSRGLPVHIHTDSKYSIGVLSAGWKAKANRELIDEIHAKLRQAAGCRFTYVPGHAGIELNERADALAREAIVQKRSSGWLKSSE